nr:uncharacterized protein LOC107445760 isoform X1 [Parasteatoda tepidariorum]XP_042906053.1 uncharacterized protein LOC107445760 isoform X1 [Parasteatoda tepidariorum]
MNQESLFYSSNGSMPVNNTQLQFHNLCQMQPPTEAWSNPFATHNISALPNMGSRDTPQKMCITEEKMAARFRDMHISNQFIIPSESSTYESGNSSSSASASVNKSPSNLQQLEIMLQDAGSSDTTSKSLILAPELKKLVEPEKILSTFLNKIEKPSMALVVWQPLNNKLTEKHIPKGEASDIKHNNNNLTPQQLSMMCHQYLSSQETSDKLCQIFPEDEMET